MYEGEVRFEHCYKMDELPHIPLIQKRECWREWTHFYTYGQTRDRIEYAFKRQRMLSSEIMNPEGHAAAAADAGSTLSPILAGPAPTNAFESPPKVHTAKPVDAGPDVAPVDAGPSPDSEEMDILDLSDDTPPGTKGLLKCFRTWKLCRSECTTNKPRCRAKCDLLWRSCVPKCVQP